MITENLSTLKIHKLTQAQYDREQEAGRLEPYAIYLTSDENEEDVSGGGVGKNVTGQEFEIEIGGAVETVVAEEGAEIFNDYENNVATG